MKLSFSFCSYRLPLLLASALTLSSAHATRARISVMGAGDPSARLLMGSGQGGSLYYDTPYNTFYNPAYVASVPNFASIEKSNAPGSNAMGLLIKKVGSLHLGLAIGRVWDTTLESASGLPDLTGALSTLTFAQSNAVRTLEMFVGGAPRENLSWGTGLSWGRLINNNGTATRDDDQTALLLKLRLGMRLGKIEPFAHWMLIGNEKVNSTTPGSVVELKHRDYLIGTRVSWEDWKFYTGFRKYSLKTKQPANVKDQVDDVLGLGANHQVAVTEKSQLYYGMGYWRLTSEDHDIAPLHVALEISPLNWLELRTGLQYALVNVRRGASQANGITGRLGATLKHDAFAFDWMIGSNASRSGTGLAGVEGTGDGDSQNFGFDSGFFTAAALRAEW